MKKKLIGLIVSCLLIGNMFSTVQAEEVFVDDEIVEESVEDSEEDLVLQEESSDDTYDTEGYSEEFVDGLIEDTGEVNQEMEEVDDQTTLNATGTFKILHVVNFDDVQDYFGSRPKTVRSRLLKDGEVVETLEMERANQNRYKCEHFITLEEGETFKASRYSLEVPQTGSYNSIVTSAMTQSTMHTVTEKYTVKKHSENIVIGNNNSSFPSSATVVVPVGGYVDINIQYSAIGYHSYTLGYTASTDGGVCLDSGCTLTYETITDADKQHTGVGYEMSSPVSSNPSLLNETATLRLRIISTETGTHNVPISARIDGNVEDGTFSSNKVVHLNVVSNDCVGHVFEEIEELAPTCTGHGKITRRCKICGIEDYIYTDPSPDDHNAVYHFPEVQPTCKEDGNIAYTVCTNCGKKWRTGDFAGGYLSDEEIIIPKDESLHNFGGEYEKGNPEEFIKYICKECSVCGKEVVVDTITAPISIKLVEEATCQHGSIWQEYAIRNDGVEVPTGDPIERQDIGDHKWGEEFPSPYNDPMGTAHKSAHKCEWCGLIEETTGTGNAVALEYLDPTCEEPGYEIHYTHRNNGERLDLSKEAIQGSKPLGHDWGDWVVTKEATATEDGLKKHICKRDSNHVETEVIPRLNGENTSGTTGEGGSGNTGSGAGNTSGGNTGGTGASSGTGTNSETTVSSSNSKALKVTAKGLKNNKVKIKKGKTLKLKVTGGSGKLTFKSSNKKIATVSKTGKIKTKKKGKVTITIKKGKKTKKIKVIVK